MIKSLVWISQNIARYRLWATEIGYERLYIFLWMQKIMICYVMLCYVMLCYLDKLGVVFWSERYFSLCFQVCTQQTAEEMTSQKFTRQYFVQIIKVSIISFKGTVKQKNMYSLCKNRKTMWMGKSIPTPHINDNKIFTQWNATIWIMMKYVLWKVPWECL